MTKKEAIEKILIYYKNDNPIVITSCGSYQLDLLWLIHLEK